jgi:dTDP-4-dehydrorhamnose reductase
MRKTVLIVGASSFLGCNLVSYLKDHYRIIGTFKDTPVRFPGIQFYKCDALKKDRVGNLVAMLRPDITIYAGGLSSQAACHYNPKLADALNSAALINVCSSAERYGSKFIFVSSCFVLGGEEIEYVENDTPFPVSVYGSSLASSEFYVQKSCLNYVIFRSSPLYGSSYHPKRRNWLESIERSLSLSQVAQIDDQVLHGHLDVKVLCHMIHMAIEKNVTNRLFQVSSRDITTRYDFARKICKRRGLDENLISRAQWTFPIDESSSRAKGRDRHVYRMSVKNAEDFFQIRLPTTDELVARD